MASSVRSEPHTKRSTSRQGGLSPGLVSSTFRTCPALFGTRRAGPPTTEQVRAQRPSLQDVSAASSINSPVALNVSSLTDSPFTVTWQYDHV